MSRYSDLRWKIADLEKELEEEKIYNKKLLGQIETYIHMICDQEKTIEELKQLISAVNKVGGKDGK
jgi:hypothetical protein